MTDRPIPLAASRHDYLLLLLLSAMWGGSFLLIKIAVGSLPPLWVAALRITIGGLALLAVVQFRGLRLPVVGASGHASPSWASSAIWRPSPSSAGVSCKSRAGLPPS